MLDSAKRGEIRLSADGWYKLTMLVTESEDEAEQAMRDYIMNCYRRGETPQ